MSSNEGGGIAFKKHDSQTATYFTRSAAAAATAGWVIHITTASVTTNGVSTRAATFYMWTGALKSPEWTTRHQVAGVENAGRSGVRRRNGTCWTTNASRRTRYMTRYDNGAYSRIQFLTAVSHSMGALSLTEALCPAADSSSSSDEDEASSATTTAADSSLWHDIVVIQFSNRLQLDLKVFFVFSHV